MKSFLSGIGSQQKCFDRSILTDDKFFIVHQKAVGTGTFTNTYSSCPSIDNFLSYYDQQSEDKKCLRGIVKPKIIELKMDSNIVSNDD